jgi:hypothetical protein
MITATEAARMSNEKLNGIEKTPEFLEIMQRIDSKIHDAIAAGKRYIGIISYTLMEYNRRKFPSFVDRNKINAKTFWWRYVRSELEKNGFTIYKTDTIDHYTVEW